MSEENKATSYVRVVFRNNEDYNVIMGRQDSLKSYTYIAEGTVEELQKYQYAVVDAPNGGYKLVLIQSVEELDFSTYKGNYKYVVDFVDDTAYKERIERKKRKDALEKEIRRRLEEKRKNMELELLIGDDIELKTMLNELKSL